MPTNEIEKPVGNEVKEDEILNLVPLTGNPAELLRNPKIIDQLFSKDAEGNIIINAGEIYGTDVYAENFRYLKNTIQFLLGNVNVIDGGWTTSISAGGTLDGLGSNQMSLSLASAASEDSYFHSQGYGIVLGNDSTNAVQWNYNPEMEFWGICTITGTNPVAKVRIGTTPANNVSYIGWTFQVISGSVRPVTRGYNPGGAEAVTAVTITDIDASKWHKYRIEVEKTSVGSYTLRWYVDDVLYSTQYFTSEWTTTATAFSVDVANNVADIAETISLQIAHAQFQQNYA